jgi:hypothetical protein
VFILKHPLEPSLGKSKATSTRNNLVGGSLHAARLINDAQIVRTQNQLRENLLALYTKKQGAVEDFVILFVQRKLHIS